MQWLDGIPVDKKRVLGPSFFITLALLFALIISSIKGYLFWWGGVSALLVLYMVYSQRQFVWNPLSLSVVIFISILLVSALAINPVFSSEGIYYISYFAISFMVFSRLPEELMPVAFKLVISVFMLLSLWALFQYLTGMGYLVLTNNRANTIFFTPNTFAAALNLVLLPVIAIYFQGSKGWLEIAVIVLLFAALVVSQSRGGMIAFIIGLLFLFGMLLKENTRQHLKAFRTIAFCFVIVILVFGVIQLGKINQSGATPPETIHQSDAVNNLAENITTITRTGTAVSSINERLIIYQVAWELIKEKPLLGYGYNNFQFYWQRDQKPPYIGSGTRFVHNDYLQIWMETGIFGLLSLLSIIFVFYYQVFSRYQALPEKYKIYCIAIASGLTSYFIHALVDFVMYPPVLLLMFGASLGITCQLTQGERMNIDIDARFSKLLHTLHLRPALIRIIAGGLLIVWFSQPAVAQLAFEAANRKVSKLDVPEALPWYELARRFAPYESDYYLYEGALWAGAVAMGNFRESAERADRLFAQGAEVNPFRIRNLLSRAILHREHGELLDHPADPATILDWINYVLTWQPHNTYAQSEYVKTLFMMGQTDLAESKYREWIKQYPGSKDLKRIADEYGL